MEKLAFGISSLTLLYIVFLYVTVKTLLKDASGSPLKETKKKSQEKNRIKG